MHATYNITDDRLKFWPPEGRLSPEEDKKRHAANFQWWPGRKCFSAIWTPQGEDWIRSFGVEIEEDDTPDDLEGRVERFEGYAEDASRQAENATQRAMEATTARKARLAEGTALKQAEEAEYWQRRIAGAIQRAQYRDNPGVISRRIKGLEARQRKDAKELKEHAAYLKAWKGEDKPTDAARAERLANYHSFYVTLPDGRQTSAWSALHDGIMTWEQVKPFAIEYDSSLVTHYTRWLEHLGRRLEYERAYLEAVGGDPAAKVAGLKAGDSVRWGSHVCKIVKMNKVSAEIDVPGYIHLRKVSTTELQPA